MSERNNAISIAIIGAGNSGMLAYNSCREQGLTATVFELTDQICGLWLYRETVTEGCSPIYRSLIYNSSKEMTAISNFPPPKEFPTYMPHEKAAQYFNLYAEKIGFKESVKLKHQVINCEQNYDYEESGKWMLTIRDLDNDTQFTQIFDGVMVCTGQFQEPNEPTFKDQDKFKGRVIHSRYYRDREEFVGKTVVVIGFGISADDIAVELSETSKVYMSVRSGAWLTSRIGPWGLPSDYFGQRRVIYSLPRSFIDFGIEHLFNFRIDHEFYGIKPKHRFSEQLFHFSEQLPLKMITGQVTIKGEVDRFTRNGLVFKGENSETVCDVVILGTGYRRSIPFLESILSQYDFDISDQTNLYRNQFFPFLKHQTLCVIGWSLLHGSVLPIAELQSRWFSHLMAGNVKLPDQKQIIERVIERQKRVKKEFPKYRQLSVDGNGVISFMDSLADEFGAKPNLWKYLLTDPKLWWNLYFGPFLPYQYRLQGPNKWSEARDAILSAESRMRIENRVMQRLDGRQHFH